MYLIRCFANYINYTCIAMQSAQHSHKWLDTGLEMWLTCD